VKLLLDENLSYRIVGWLVPVFAHSQHVDSVGLHGRSGWAIWEFCPRPRFHHRFERQRLSSASFLYGAPPKVIWLSAGNATTEDIVAILNNQLALIERFLRDPEESLLILEFSGESK
jgi:predicted nuclease of predicted toxin-antitoxin system